MTKKNFNEKIFDKKKQINCSKSTKNWERDLKNKISEISKNQMRQIEIQKKTITTLSLWKQNVGPILCTHDLQSRSSATKTRMAELDYIFNKSKMEEK